MLKKDPLRQKRPETSTAVDLDAKAAGSGSGLGRGKMANVNGVEFGCWWRAFGREAEDVVTAVARANATGGMETVDLNLRLGDVLGGWVTE